MNSQFRFQIKFQGFGIRNLECGMEIHIPIPFHIPKFWNGNWNNSTFHIPEFWNGIGIGNSSTFQIPFHSYSIVVVTNLFTMLFNFKFHSNSTVDGMECGISVWYWVLLGASLCHGHITHGHIIIWNSSAIQASVDHHKHSSPCNKNNATNKNLSATTNFIRNLDFDMCGDFTFGLYDWVKLMRVACLLPTLAAQLWNVGLDTSSAL